MTLRLWRRAPAQPEPWVAVPRIDLLEQGARSTQSLGARLLLILVVAVELAAAALLATDGAILIQEDGTLLYQNGAAVQRDVDRASADLDAALGELGARQSEIPQLEIERDNLRQRVAESAALRGSSVAWRPPMAAFVELARDGVQLHSINGNAPDQLTVVAGSSDQDALARFQRELQQPDQPFSLQDLQWGSTAEELRLTVSVLLKP